MHHVEITLSMPNAPGDPPTDALTVARTIATLLSANVHQHGIVVHALHVETQDA